MRSCPVPPLMRRPIRSRVPVAILFTSTLSRMGMRSESPCALGVIVTEPITVVDGHVAVPTAPGLGFEIDDEFLDSITTARTFLNA